ncbi:hypothetical protein A4X06_0g6498, partial [Tilletia controversa]
GAFSAKAGPLVPPLQHPEQLLDLRLVIQVDNRRNDRVPCFTFPDRPQLREPRCKVQERIRITLGSCHRHCPLPQQPQHTQTTSRARSAAQTSSISASSSRLKAFTPCYLSRITSRARVPCPVRCACPPLCAVLCAVFASCSFADGLPVLSPFSGVIAIVNYCYRRVVQPSPTSIAEPPAAGLRCLVPAKSLPRLGCWPAMYDQPLLNTINPFMHAL